MRRSGLLSHRGHHFHDSEVPRDLSGHESIDPRVHVQNSIDTHNEGTRVTVLGIVINIALSVGKGIAGVMGNSTALVADAVHSLGDLASDAVTLYTHKISTKGPSPSYPYGYGRFDSLGGFVVSLLLVGTGIGIGYHAIFEMFGGAVSEPIHQIALWVAGASLMIKEALFQITLRTANKIKSNVLIANAWHHRSDAYTSGVALIGIGAGLYGVPYADALAGLAVAGFIVEAASPVIKSSIDEITDRNDFIQVDKAIRELAVTMNIQVDRLRVRKSGGHLIADISVIVEQKDAPRLLFMTRDFKTKIREQFPVVYDISVELQEKGLEEFHPEHGPHPPGTSPDMAKHHEQVEKESKVILPKVKDPL